MRSGRQKLLINLAFEPDVPRCDEENPAQHSENKSTQPGCIYEQSKNDLRHKYKVVAIANYMVIYLCITNLIVACHECQYRQSRDQELSRNDEFDEYKLPGCEAKEE